MAERSTIFTCLVYPDSAPSDWLERLDSLKVQAVVSPLHDQDLNEDGTLKKPHFHVVLKYSSLKSFAQVQSDFDYFGGVYPSSDTIFSLQCKVRNLSVICRYLCHMDHPDKAQYSAESIRCFGGFDFFEAIEGDISPSKTIGEICDFCVDNGFSNFMRLCIYARHERPDWFIFLVNNAYFFKTFLASVREGAASVEGFFPEV